MVLLSMFSVSHGTCEILVSNNVNNSVTDDVDEKFRHDVSNLC